MSEFVKRTMMGYKEVSGGHSDPECTHVILTKREYEKLLQEKQKAEIDARIAKSDADNEIAKAKSNAAYTAQQACQEAQDQVVAIQEELERERAESAHQRALNANLLRVSRERANADRRLKPKKEHTGYGVVVSGEKEYRYKDGNRQWRDVMLWETTIQSPYAVDMPEPIARRLISDELLKKNEGGKSLLNRLGIHGYYPGSYADMIEDQRWCSHPEQYNIALEFYFQVNGRYGYWEVKFYHTKALSLIPQELRLR